MTTIAEKPKRKPFNFGEKLRNARSKMEHRFAAVISEEDKSFDPEALLASIRDQLIAERREMVLKLMGFRTSWGTELEINTSRNRTPLQTFIEKAVSDATNKWVAENPTFFEEAVQDTLKNPRFKAALRRRFVEQFEWRMRQSVEEAAALLAKEEAQVFYNEARSQLSMATPED